MFNSYIKALFASRNGVRTFSVIKTNEFIIYGNDWQRYAGSFVMFENGKPAFEPVPYFEARCN